VLLGNGTLEKFHRIAEYLFSSHQVRSYFYRFGGKLYHTTF